MTQEEYNKFEAELKAKGYRQYPSANDETDTYDEGFDPDKLSYHDIVLNIIKELKAK